MVVLFLSIVSFLVYRYHKNQRRYLKTLTRTIYDTLQKSGAATVSPYLQITPSIAQGFDRSSLSGSHHSQYTVAYVYK
jgi:hypothetical protein